MRELSSSWQYTINEKMGMFSDPSIKLHPHDVRPHVILIEVSHLCHSCYSLLLFIIVLLLLKLFIIVEVIIVVFVFIVYIQSS